LKSILKSKSKKALNPEEEKAYGTGCGSENIPKSQSQNDPNHKSQNDPENK